MSAIRPAGEVGGFWTLPPDLPTEDQERLRRPNLTYLPVGELLECYRDLMQGIADLTSVTGFCYWLWRRIKP